MVGLSFKSSPWKSYSTKTLSPMWKNRYSVHSCKKSKLSRSLSLIHDTCKIEWVWNVTFCEQSRKQTLQFMKDSKCDAQPDKQHWFGEHNVTVLYLGCQMNSALHGAKTVLVFLPKKVSSNDGV